MKRAWSERISQAGRPAQAGWPEQGTLACFFEGVEQLTGQYYPRWRLQQLLEQYEITGEFTFSRMVRYAGECLERGKEMLIPSDLETGYQLLYTLLAEPFYLMSQNQKEESCQ